MQSISPSKLGRAAAVESEQILFAWDVFNVPLDRLQGAEMFCASHWGFFGHFPAGLGPGTFRECEERLRVT